MTSIAVYKFVARGFSIRSLEQSIEILPGLWFISGFIGILPSIVGTLIFSIVVAAMFPIMRKMWFPVWMALGGLIGAIIGGGWLSIVFMNADEPGEIATELLIAGTVGSLSGAGGALIFKGILCARMPRWRQKA